MTDKRTPCTTEAHLTVTCHHLDMDWQMKNQVLQTHSLNNLYTGANLGKNVKD